MPFFGRHIQSWTLITAAVRLAGLTALLAVPSLRAADADALIKDALAAETKLDSRHALELFLEADQARPNDAFIVQKIARQYSDLVVEQKSTAEKKHYAETALEFAKRSVELEPKNAVNVLSLAVCHGTLGIYSDTKTKVEYSRFVKDETEHALALDPNYAWAHHVLGRWNYEVATLGIAARVVVRLCYGGLPSASTAKAVEELSRAVALEPDQLEHHLELGFAYLADGQKAKAHEQFEQGLAMPSRDKHDDPAKERARAELAKSA
jgi:tetratricopeptide (TPR) repeat protein